MSKNPLETLDAVVRDFKAKYQERETRIKKQIEETEKQIGDVRQEIIRMELEGNLKQIRELKKKVEEADREWTRVMRYLDEESIGLVMKLTGLSRDFDNILYKAYRGAL